MAKPTPRKDIVQFVRKSNDLVESKYKFDLWETRIFTKTLTMIHKDDQDFKEYKIHLNDIVRDFGLENDKASYEHIRQAADKLADKRFYVRYEEEGTPRYFKVPVVSKVDAAEKTADRVIESQRYIKIQFHPDMKPFLLQLKQQFTIYDVRNILRLPSPYSIRIYELLKQYEKIGRRSFELQELKEILGLDKEYPKYGNFKQRVILKAQKDLKKYTDIYFTFDQHKKGRSVYKLTFYIHKNEQKRLKPSKNVVTEVQDVSDASEALFQRVAHLHVVKKTFVNWCEKFSEEQMGKAVSILLNHIENGATITNPSGYLYQLLKQPTLFDSGEEKREQKRQKKQVQQEKETLKKELEALLQQLKKEHYDTETTIIEALYLEQPGLQEDILELVRTKPFAKYDSRLSVEENLERRTVISAMRNAVKKKFPERFKQREELFKQKKSHLNSRISQL